MKNKTIVIVIFLDIFSCKKSLFVLIGYEFFTFENNIDIDVYSVNKLQFYIRP